MREISGNILSIKAGIIAHQVNCKGVMNAGLAKSLRDKYPVIYPSYHKYCQSGFFKPGMVQFIKVSHNLYICNLAGQDGYGRERKYTDEYEVGRALSKLAYGGQETGLPIYIPYKMGCGLGGGDWAVISQLIEDWCPEAIVIRLPQS